MLNFRVALFENYNYICRLIMHYTDQERYAIDYQSLEYTPYSCEFDVDDALFTERESEEVKGVKCKAFVEANRTGSTVDVDVRITGTVVVACDRCLEDCAVAVDYVGDLVVKFSDEIDDYDGEVLWMSPAEDYLDLTQYIYESIVISLPYRRVHEEGGCNPEMLASFGQITEEEFERMEREAEESDQVGLDDTNRKILEALKQQMEGRD